MKTIQTTLQNITAHTIIIPVFETEKNVFINGYENISIKNEIFSGKKDSHYIFYANEKTFLLLGIGKNPDFKTVQTIFRRASMKQKNVFANKTALILPEDFSSTQCKAAISGLRLGTYALGHFKTEEQQPHIFATENFELQIVSENSNLESTIIDAQKLAAAQLEVFELVDLPPNVVNPQFMADWALAAAKEYGFETEILDAADCKKAGLDAFLAVAQGSQNAPRFIIMKYRPKASTENTKHIGLVGKGITFDTGGLNIKTAGMVHMKCDMGGAAAVMGALRLVADMELAVQVTAVIPCAENAIGSKAFLPSAVIGSYSGHSIEIIDTDAEGRLILADAISYLIKNFAPETVIDMATLTGSSVATFGYECAVLFTNNAALEQALRQSGNDTGERLWPLPLWDAYKGDIDSEIADVKNYSGKPVAGAISAAKFLEFFTENHPSWAHIDIAGVAFGDSEFAKTKHATAFGVHLLTHFIQKL